MIVPAVCNGTVALLQGSVPTGGNGTYTYRWESTSSSNCADNSFTPISGATQKDYSVPSTANQQLCYRRVVISGTCSSVSNKTKVQGADLTTPSPPTVSITNPNCAAGGTITVTQPAPAPGISYSINGTDYSNTSGIFSSLAAGSYSVTAKLLSGCISLARAVNLAAAAAPTGSITPASAAICTGQSQVLTVSGGTSYQWYRNNTIITGATSNTYTATQAGTYRADIINGSCTGASSNSSVITILPSPNGTITPATANLCAGDSVNLSASGGSSYQWYRDNVLINGAVSSTYKAKQAGTYSVDIIGSNGCKVQATNTAVITMTSAPAGTIAPAAVTICTGGSATLTSNGGTSYQWYKDNVIIVGATAATYIATQPGTYKTEITNAAGCKAFSSNNAVVSVGASPSGSITPASGQLCGNNASLTLTVGGGTSYQWYRNGVAISGATAATYIVTTTGTYTAQITSGSCTGMATNSVVISQGAAPSGSISPASSTLCPGESQLLSVSGGTSYQWMRNGVDIAGANSSTYLASQPGTYTVTIINGTCSGPASNAATVTAGTAPTGTITPANATICTGSSQVLTATGGASYQWFKDNVIIPGATAATYTATQPGTYKTEITNTAGCKAFSSNNAVVFVGSSPSGTIAPASGQLCGNNASLTLTVSGGTSYQWYKNGVVISGATAASYTVTTAGTYTAEIFSANCSGMATNSVVISQAAAPTGQISPAEATICPGESQLLSISGGTSYQWLRNGVDIPGATSSTYLASQSGTYTVRINNGTCSGNSINAAIITAGVAPTGTITPANAAICTGSSQVLTATGGVSYQWFKDNVLIPGATSATYTATQQGSYSVDLTSSNGCKAKASNNAVVTITATPVGSITPASAAICTGQSQVLTVSGGTSYQWYRNNTIITGATSNTYTATQAGTYRADIINGSCTGASSNSSVITILPSPNGTITPATANLCAGDSVNLSASGGSSYQWYRDNVLINGAVSSTYKAKQAGTYSVDIIGSNGCKVQATNTAVITMTSAPAGTIAPAAVTICTGGSATLTSNGGTSYQWYKDNVIIVGATAATYIATQPGTYKTEITNAAGCKAFSSNNAVVSVGASPSGSITPASGQLCGNNASLTLTVGGGTSYQWYRNGVAISGATAATYIVTTTGTYTAQITSGSCTGMATNSVVISQGAAPSGSISPASSTLCPGESQLLSVSGGTSYQWMRNGVDIAGANSSTYLASQPGTYTVTIINGTCSGPASNAATVTAGTAPTGTITPANATICTGSSQVLTATGGASYQWFKDNVIIPGATAATYTATQPGSYSVDLISSNGCKAKASNNAVVTITAAPTGAISPATGTLCTNGSLVLTVTGGSTYQWYRNGILISGAIASTYTVTQPGTYTADIISGGCKASATNAATITQGPAPSGFITPASATICAAQNVTLTAGGGTSYQWFLNGNAISGATASTYIAALPGTYSVTIFSGTCSGPASNTAIVSASTPITFSVNTVQPTCGQPQGTITFNSVTGGSGGYLYSINNGSNFQSANTFSNLPAGTYSLMVKDASDCRSTVQPVVINPASSTLLASITTTNITCTQPTGTVTVSTNGGTMPYQYSLDGGPPQSANSFTNVTAGSHRVVIIDAGGCTLELAFTIQSINSTLGATVTTTNPTCGQQTGSVQITATGGTPGYTYSLDNGAYQAANSFTNVATGTHLIKVKDQAGCITQVNFQIDQTGTPPTLIITPPPPICVGATANLQNASITAGSDTALTFTYWNDTTATSPVANPAAVPAGKYFIKATNRGGCFTIKPVTVTSSATTGSISVSGSATPCRGQVVTLTASNGISYQWYLNNNPITGAVANTYPVTTDGTYSVLIDNGNCRAFASNQIQIQYKDCPTLTDPKVFVPTAFSPNNNNANDVLRPILHGILELRYFRVYNRWGQLVFQTNTIGKGWDGMLNGKPQPSEPFSWMLECIDINGNTIKQSGRSILIR